MEEKWGKFWDVTNNRIYLIETKIDLLENSEVFKLI